MPKVIQVLQPNFEIEETLEAIRECLEAKWTGAGFKTVEIEKNFESLSGHKNCLFLNSNTSGLHLALEVFKEVYNWNAGSEVITTSLTFISTNSVIKQSGLKPKFCDVDSSLNLDPKCVKRMITDKTAAIIFVGIGGNTKNLKEIGKIANECNIPLIVDAAHMAGSKFHSNSDLWAAADCGAHAAVYSFQAVKNIATADSGMVSFDIKSHFELAKKKSWMGISKDTYERLDGYGKYNWRYSVDTLGYKYNGNSIMAAMAVVQLNNLEKSNKLRRNIFNYYKNYLNREIPIICHENKTATSQHLVQILVDDREYYISQCSNDNINLGVHYLPNHKFKIFESETVELPLLENLSEKILTLPCHENLTESDLSRIVKSINSSYDMCLCKQESN